MSYADDVIAIQSLHNIFSHAADMGDYELLRSTYTEDGWDDHTGFSGYKDDYIAWVENIQNGYESLSHFFSNLLVSVDGDTAESVCGLQLYLRVKADSPYNRIVVGRSFDRYARVSGKWLFSRRTQIVDWGQTFAPDEGPPTFTKREISGRNRSDPFFTNLATLDAKLQSGWRGAS